MKRSEFLGLLALPFLAPLIKLEDKPTGKGLLAQISENKSTLVFHSPNFVWTELAHAHPGDLLMDENGESLYCAEKKGNRVKLYKTICTQPPIGKEFRVICSCFQENQV